MEEPKKKKKKKKKREFSTTIFQSTKLPLVLFLEEASIFDSYKSLKSDGPEPDETHGRKRFQLSIRPSFELKKSWPNRVLIYGQRVYIRKGDCLLSHFQFICNPTLLFFWFEKLKSILWRAPFRT